MKRFLLLFVVLFIFAQGSWAQLSGIKTIPSDYATIEAAVAVLNAQGVGAGGVTFNVAAGHIEIATGLIDITASGTVANPIVFQKSGAGLNPRITASGNGTINGTQGSDADAIIQITGGDFITFDGIDVQENGTATGIQLMEYGYFLKKASATDAPKNITIKNCDISLIKTTQYSYGIIVSNIVGTTDATITSIGGRSENIRIFNNTISNVAGGIRLSGYNHTLSPYDFYDQNIEIGVDGGNTITNFGSGTNNAYGVYAEYQNNCKINNNNITGGDGSDRNVYGVLLSTSINGSYDVNNNYISLGVGVDRVMAGIYMSIGTTGNTNNTINVNNNTLTNFRRPGSVSGNTFFIFSDYNNPYNININNNIIGNSTIEGSGAVYGIQQGSLAGNIVIDGNTISNITREGTVATNSVAAIWISGNTTGPNCTISNNLIHSLTSNTSQTVVGIQLQAMAVANVFNNKVYDLNTTNAIGYALGISIGNVINGNIYNNLIGDLNGTAIGTSTASNPNIIGIMFWNLQANSSLNVSYNSVYLNATSSGTNFGTAGLRAIGNATATSANLVLKNNLIVNNSTSNGVGKTIAYLRTDANLANYDNSSNNNLFYAGTPGASNLIFYDGTNSDQSLVSFQTRVSPRETASISENPAFISTVGSSNDFLKIDPVVLSQIESGGQRITTPVAITTDYFGTIRALETGYDGTGTAPDIGAYESFTASPPTPPTIASFFPSTGSVGTLVTITGTNLQDPTAFAIGSVPAIVISNDGTTLVGMVMPGAVTGTVSVTTTDGTATTTDTFTVTPTPYPSVQQGDKLVGTDVTGIAGQGLSVAISADGNTAIVGGPYDNTNIGAAWIYTRSGSAWTQQGSKLVGTGAVGNARQGVSVAISADGNTAIVGGFEDDGSKGAVWIFIRTGSTWTQQGTKLVGDGASGNAAQGCSVDLSADGNTAIVGGYGDDGTNGASWVYIRSGGSWSQQGSKLVGSGASGIARQGHSVALSSEGNTAIVGGFEDDGSKGAVWIFTRTGAAWAQQGSKLVGSDAVGNAYQGQSVALSADGNTAIVGGYGDDGINGASWVYTRSGGSWSQQGSKLVGTGNTGTAAQGTSVALSADGNTAIVGGFFDDIFNGASWVFTRLGSAWTQQGNKLVGTGSYNSFQGYSVAISADGNTTISGGQQDNSGIGAAWIYIPAPPVAKPTVTTQAATAIAETTVTGNGTITSINGDDVTNRGLILYPYTNTDKVIDDVDVTNFDEAGTFGTGTFTFSFTPLTVNTQYNARAHATNNYGTGYGARVGFWTLANVPDAPTVDNATATTLDVAVNENANPAITEYAINETSTTNFMQADGTLGATAVWQTAAVWGTTTVTGLTTGTTYTFKVKARNGGNVETSFGAETSGSTCSNPTNGGEIDGNQTICYNSEASELGNVMEASDYGGTLEYQWQSNTVSSTFTFDDIVGAVSNTYSPGTLMQTTWFKRLARAGCMADWSGAVSSNVVEVTISPDFTSGEITNTGETICYNTSPTEAIGNTTAASGGDNTITYSWRSSVDNYAAAIDGATLSTYTPAGPLTSSTSYRRYAKDNTCNTTPGVSTGTWTVSVEQSPLAGTLSKTPDVTYICQNDEVSASLTAGSGGNGTDELEYRTRTGSNWSDWTVYISENEISSAGKTEIEIRSRRISDYCSDSDYTTLNWIIDLTNPVVVARVSGSVTLDPSGNYTLTPSDVLSSYSDAGVGIETITIVPASVSCADLGLLSVTVTVIDYCGNQSVATPQITVLEGTALLSPWVQVNTSPGANGSAEYSPCTNDGTFHLTSQGISAPKNDVMNFAYQPLCGTGTVIAQLDDSDNGGWAGVMMRESNAPGSKAVLFKTKLYNPSVIIGYRATTNAKMVNISQTIPSIHWMKIQRNGNTFQVFTSYNGTVWNRRYTTTVVMPNCIEAGIFTESIQTNRVVTSWFDHVEVAGYLKAGEDEISEIRTDEAFEIEFYPNPANDQITIMAPENSRTISVTLINTSGSVIETDEFNTMDAIYNLQHIKPGVYLLRFERDGQVVNKRLIVM